MTPTVETKVDTPSEDGFPSIGLRLRYERRTRRMRLKDLAEAAGSSESLLSRIENGLVTPSLTTLHRLCKALKISVPALLTPSSEKECLIYRQGERPHYSNGEAVEGDGTTAEILVPFAEGRMLEAHIWQVPANSKWCGPYRHIGEEAGYVLEGAMELRVSGESQIVRAGDSFFFKSEMEHSFRAHGDSNCRIVWFNTPPTF